MKLPYNMVISISTLKCPIYFNRTSFQVSGLVIAALLAFKRSLWFSIAWIKTFLLQLVLYWVFVMPSKFVQVLLNVQLKLENVVRFFRNLTYFGGKTLSRICWRFSYYFFPSPTVEVDSTRSLAVKHMSCLQKVPGSIPEITKYGWERSQLKFSIADAGHFIQYWGRWNNGRKWHFVW